MKTTDFLLNPFAWLLRPFEGIARLDSSIALRIAPLVVAGLATGGGLLAQGVGAYLSGKGTQDAQKEANRAAARAAMEKSANDFWNYLSSRGISLQQIAASHPVLKQTWETLAAQGDNRSFEQWLYEHLRDNPGDALWNEINSGSVGASNTTLPNWAVDANGNPLQPSLLNQLVGISGQSDAARKSAIAQKWSAAEQRLKQAWDEDPGYKEVYGTFENYVLADYEGNASPEQKAAIEAEVGQTTADTTTLDPAIKDLLGASTTTAQDLFNGTYLQQTLDALKPMGDARNAEAAAILKRIGEQRGLSTDLLNTELGGLDAVTAARTAGAADIYGASTRAAQQEHDANVAKLAELLNVRLDAAQAIYDASVKGAEGIRGAEMTQADTFKQAAEEAATRLLAEESANRARQGFTGPSSGSDITRARIMADYIQRGAGARAQADVNYQGRLSDAGVGRAGTIGRSREADAADQLAAAVQLARSLGIADVNRATSIASTNEQDAIGRLQARSADATRRLQYLTSDADIAKAQADFANAQDALNAIMGDQQRKVGAVSLPYELANADLATKTAQEGQKYANIDQLLKRLQSFQIQPATGSPTTISVPQPVMNSSQIWGGVLSNVGSGLLSMGSSQLLGNLINRISSSGQAAPAAAPSQNPFPLGSSINLNSSVFPGPGQPAYCWVAREVYGERNPRWIQFRDWLLTRASDGFRRFYIENGERIADFIRDNADAKRVIRSLFDQVLEGA